MKITYKAVAILSVAALLAAVAQMKIHRNHSSEQSSSFVLVSQQDTDVNALQEKLKTYEDQVRAQLERVENARQDAISAGIQGDSAQDYIYVYQQEQAKADTLQAALVPQIKQVRAKIAILTGKDSEASSLAQSRQP